MRFAAYLAVCLLTLTTSTLTTASDPGRVLPPSRKPADYRLGKAKDLDGYFPMHVPADLAAWQTRRRELREQMLVATGLWPMPPRPA